MHFDARVHGPGHLHAHIAACQATAAPRTESLEQCHTRCEYGTWAGDSSGARSRGIGHKTSALFLRGVCRVGAAG
eukprot:1201397-Rhodomonas_salina.2